MSEPWLPSKEQEEDWCVRMWIDWRRSEGLGDLIRLDSAPPGPDRLFQDGSGRVVGVEMTRLLHPADREAESFAAIFLLEEVAPLVEGRVPSTIFAMVELPWSIPQSRRRQVAEVLAEQIVAVSGSLAVGKSAQCDVDVRGTSVDLGILRAIAAEPRLRIGSIGWPAKWDSDHQCAAAVAEAIRRKAARRQLASPDLDQKILLLHDRLPGISSQALTAAIRNLDEATAFDEIFLVDTYEPGRCARAWPLLE